MGMVVRTNTMSSNAYRQLGMNNTQLAKSLEKLSSGYRINRAGDDASGLAISEKMKAQIKGLEQSSSNAQDGISLVQTAEGALTEVHSMLNRMVELATKSSNGTIQTDVDREAIQTEVDALNKEISRISQSTNFNGINLLDGSLGGADPVLTGGATFGDTKATLNSTAMDAFTAGSVAFQAGDTVNYTVSWVDKDGKAQETKLTFTAQDATHLIGNSGTSYTVTSGAMTGTEFGNAIKGELDLNTSFASSFTTTNTAGTMTYESKNLGADGGKVIAVTVAESRANTACGAGTTATLTAGVDAGKKLDLSNVKVAATGESVADMTKKVFTIDGKKFLAVTNAVTSTEIAALDKDINIIQLSDADTAITGATNTATDVQTAVDAINRAFGKTGTDVEYTRATTANAAANIAVNDIIYDPKSKGLSLQVGDSNADFNKVTVSVDDLSAKGLGTEGLDVSSQTAASDAIATIKEAINKVSTNRGNLGALQNRLEHAINNLDTTAENMDAANSRIRDTDMAKEMMSYTKMNILSQAAQAMLAQANQQPQSILQLLQ